MSDLDKLPGWMIPAVLGGVVLVALMSSKGGGSSGGSVGQVTTLAPTPADPNVIAEMESETSARSSVITSLINMMGSEETSRISAGRDVTISGINASVANRRTDASEAVGLAQTDAQLKASLANAASAADINRTNVAGATSRAHIEAKASTGKAIIDGVVSFGKSILHMFGG